MLLWTLAFFSCNILLTLAQNYQLHNATTSVLPGASEACLQAFNTPVNCFHAIGQLYANPFYTFNDDAELTTLCTSTCLQSLTSHRNTVASACAGVQYYDEYEDTHWVPTYPEDFIIFAYDIACLKRKSGLTRIPTPVSSVS